MRFWLACFVCMGCAVARERDVDGGRVTDVLRDRPTALGDAGDDPRASVDGAELGPTVCPPRGPSFSFAAAGTFDLASSLEWITLRGDGDSIYAVVRTYPMGISVLRLDPAGTAVVEVLRHDGSYGALAVDDGVARVVVRDEPTSETLRFFDSSAGPFRATGTMPAPGASIGPGLVHWNGSSLVAAIQTGDYYNVWIGPFAPGPPPASWHERWPAEEPSITIDRATGSAHVVMRTAFVDERRWLAIDPTGALVSDTVLDSVGLLAWGQSIAWVEDGTGEPMVVTAHVVGPVAGAPIVQRFTTEGRLGSTVRFSSHALHSTMTGVVPRGVTTGYAVAAIYDDDRRVAFHAAANGVASEVVDLPTECRESVAIAAGACGWLVACEHGTTIDTFLAVPPAP